MGWGLHRPWNFSERKLVQLKLSHPEADIIAHPECEANVLRHADFIGSTTGLLKYVQNSDRQEFIVVTESGVIHQMQKASPSKNSFLPPNSNCACNECPYMRLNTLEKVYLAMKNRSPEIILDESIRQAALKPMQRMLEMSFS